MFATGDSATISLVDMLAGIGPQWSKLTKGDDGDASYRRAAEILIAAGFVDAKVELLVQMEKRLGTIRAVYHCHGPCYDLLDTEAREHAKHNREWADNDGNIAGNLIITKRPIAVRLSADSINKYKLDRPHEKVKWLGLIAEKLAAATRDGFRYCDPEIIPLDIGSEAATGPDVNKPGVFYWHGLAHQLTKKNWQFLSAIWGHERTSLSDIAELVWNNGDMPEGTIRGQLNRLNAQIGDLKIPLAWRIERGAVVAE
jgi:hypothetical protein